MISTREAILSLGDKLIRDKGYNAFSFYDISKSLKVKNASIHYHFATKADLGVEVVKQHIAKVDELIRLVERKSAETKLKAFLSIYDYTKAEGRVCLVGSLATDLKTVEPKMKEELKVLATKILNWVTAIVEEGKRQKLFHFDMKPRTKALLIVTNMLAALQVSRLTDEKDFFVVREAVLKDLKQKR